MLRLTAGLLLLIFTSDVGVAQQVEPLPPSSELQALVVQDLRNRPVGNHTLQVLNLPDNYLQRVADRVIRASYESQFRIVVRETKPGIAPPESDTSPLNPPPVDPPGSNSRTRSLIPIGVAAAIILIAGLILARRGKGA